jgi:hypothetical protein
LQNTSQKGTLWFLPVAQQNPPHSPTVGQLAKL